MAKVKFCRQKDSQDPKNKDAIVVSDESYVKFILMENIYKELRRRNQNLM